MSKSKILIFYLILLLPFSLLLAQTPNWSWAKQAGGSSIDEGAAIAIDNSGNSYVTGYFYGTATFGSYSLTSSGLHDVYIGKLDFSGNWLWVKKANGTGSDIGNAITLDTTGNAYIIGSFSSPTLTFGSYVVTRTANSTASDMFIAKINSAGTWLWAKKMGGTSTDSGLSIAVDSGSNVYVSGTFRGTVSIETNPVTALTSYGNTDAFVAKLNSGGIWLWAKYGGGTSYDNGNGITVDSNSNVYLCGGFNSLTATFGTIVLTNTTSSTYDAFISKLDTNGNWLWAKKAGGGGTDLAYSSATDSGGNVYLTGSYSSNIYFGSLVLSNSGDYDIFTAKLDSSGNWLWATKAGGTNYDVPNFMTVDANSNIYVIGQFIGTAVFGSYSATSLGTGTSDCFIAKMNSGGTWQSLKQFGGTLDEYGKGLALDVNNDIFVCGDFFGSVVFGSTTLTTAADNQDIYIAKLGNTPLRITAPNGGETWIAGSVHNITWNAISITNVLLDYSLNNGTTWTTITTAPIAGSLGTYSWTTPSTTSTQVLVRIRESGNDNDYDVSDAVFSLTSSANPPVAGFSANVTSGLEPLTVQYTDSSSAGSGTITSRAWTFGDGGTSTLQNPQHTYQNDGLYSVSLTVTNSYSLTNTLTRTGYINVLPTNPQISLLTSNNMTFGSVNIGSQSTYQSITVQNTGNANLTISSVHFIGATSNFEYQLPARNITVTPGGTSTISVRFAPLSEGALSDTLYVVNNSINTPVVKVRLSGTGVAVHYPPQAAFVANVTTGLAPLTVQFTDQSTPVSGALSSWAWIFGDGGTSTLQNPTHTYQTAGIYDVSLTVTNSYSLSGTLLRDDYITVTAPTPRITLTTDSTMTFGSVTVGAQSAYQSLTVQNSGTANLIISNLHFYAATHNFEYQATLNITIVPGSSGTIPVRFIPQSVGALSDTLYIVNNSVNSPTLKVRLEGNGVAVHYPPQAAFVANVTTGLAPLTVQFTDQSTPVSGTLTTWAWNFGDGGTSALQNPGHTYQTAGIYDVSLTVTNSFSLTGTLLRDDYINVTAPIPQITLTSSSTMNFGSINIGSQSSYQSVSLHNPGTGNLIINDLHFYAATHNFEYQATLNIVITPGGTGFIPVRFIPQSSGALSDTLYIVNTSVNAPIVKVRLEGTGVAVALPPQADFSADTISGLKPLNVQFTDQSTPGSGTLVSWSWSFGDGFNSNEQSPLHTYQTAGVFSVSLMVTNSHTLTSTATRTNYITVWDPVGTLVLLNNQVVNFGNAYLNEATEYSSTLLRNIGNRPVNISEVHFSGTTHNFEFLLTTECQILSPGETGSLLIRFTPQSLGVLSDILTIANDSDNSPALQISLQGTGIMVPPKAPEDVVISGSGTDMHLGWDIVNENTHSQPINTDYYLVYINSSGDLTGRFTYLGLTQSLSFIHHRVASFSRRAFYRIYAVQLYHSGSVGKDNNAGIDEFLKQNLKEGMSEAEVNNILRQAEQQLTVDDEANRR